MSVWMFHASNGISGWNYCIEWCVSIVWFLLTRGLWSTDHLRGDVSGEHIPSYPGRNILLLYIMFTFQYVECMKDYDSDLVLILSSWIFAVTSTQHIDMLIQTVPSSSTSHISRVYLPIQLHLFFQHAAYSLHDPLPGTSSPPPSFRCSGSSHWQPTVQAIDLTNTSATYAYADALATMWRNAKTWSWRLVDCTHSLPLIHFYTKTRPRFLILHTYSLSHKSCCTRSAILTENYCIILFLDFHLSRPCRIEISSYQSCFIVVMDDVLVIFEWTNKKLYRVCDTILSTINHRNIEEAQSRRLNQIH